MRKRRTEEEFVKEVFNLVGNDYTIVSTYINTRTKVKIIHNVCNHSYEVEPRDFFKGRRCPKCAGNIRKTTIEFKQQVYSLVKDEYLVLGKYVNDKTKILIKHVECGKEYSTKPNTFLNGHRCPDCSRKKALLSIKNRGNRQRIMRYKRSLPPYEKSLGYLFPELNDEWSNKNHISVYQVYSHSNKKAWWKCRICGNEWETRISIRTGKQKSGCPLCNESKGEKRIRNYLKANNIPFIAQKDFDGLVGTGGGNLFYDFYLPKQNILIEYQGKQHREFVKMIHLEEDNFIKQLEHDRRKNEYAKQNNIKLLEIWYWDFENVENIIHKEIILNTLIDMTG
jgi:hypothetical protein